MTQRDQIPEEIRSPLKDKQRKVAIIDDERILYRIERDGGQVGNVFLYLAAVIYTENSRSHIVSKSSPHGIASYLTS